MFWSKSKIALAGRQRSLGELSKDYKPKRLERQKIFDPIAGGNVRDTGMFASSDDSRRKEKI